MTNAFTHDLRRPGAILSRLLVVLALVLFGLLPGHADGIATNAGPAAKSQVEEAQGILSVQRQLLRAQLSDNDTRDTVPPGAALEAWPSRNAVTMSPAPHLSLLPVAIRILPPVRGPPAA